MFAAVVDAAFSFNVSVSSRCVVSTLPMIGGGYVISMVSLPSSMMDFLLEAKHSSV